MAIQVCRDEGERSARRMFAFSLLYLFLIFSLLLVDHTGGVGIDGDGSGAERQRTIRARNRALVAVLVGLVALFYAITIVRMGG